MSDAKLKYSVSIVLSAVFLLAVAGGTGIWSVQASRAAIPTESDTTVTAGEREASIFLGMIDGPIGPITSEYVSRLLADAQLRRPDLVVITLDTPGGLDLSMRAIIKSIFASPVPVAIFVYPSGARAASAGALIMLAAHVAAMSPGTNIGAAHPVAIGEGKMDEEMVAKVTNDAAAYARSIARERGRNTEWAERIVRESISSTATEALELAVIDVMAEDVNDLLAKLDEMPLVINEEPTVLHTAEARIIEKPQSLREKFLGTISDPNFAYILMLLGIFGLFFELQNPGAIFPGVIGAISIVLAFFALQLLPVSISGVALIILAIIMFILEIKIPSGGLLSVGGVIAMIIGSIMFIDSPLPFMKVSLSVIIPAVIFTAIFFLFAVGMGLRAQRKKIRTGEGGIIGETGTARETIDPEGSVFIHGEYWNARSDTPIAAGTRVVVTAIEGMKLTVKPDEQREVE